MTGAHLEQDRGALQQAELKDAGGHETQGPSQVKSSVTIQSNDKQRTLACPVCSRTVVVGVHGNQYIGSCRQEHVA